MSKHEYPRFRKIPTRKLSADQIRSIRQEYRARVVTMKMLADKYQCSLPLIQFILDGTIYGWVKEAAPQAPTITERELVHYPTTSAQDGPATPAVAALDE